LFVTGTSWTPTVDLVSGHAYRVQVRSLNSSGLGAWSPLVNFTLARPTITPFTNATTLQPTITWSAITGATSYEIWVNDVTTAKSNIYPGAKVNTTNWTPPTNLVNGRTYSVWVKALNGSNLGVWSNPITFKVIL
jgi:O-glycosyl hydrolase